MVVWSIANATANALIKQKSGIAGDIDVNSSRLATSLFRRIRFVKVRKTSSKADIFDGPRKEIEFLVSRVEEFNIPETLIININQTPLKYVSVSKETMEKKIKAPQWLLKGVMTNKWLQVYLLLN